MVSNHQSEGKRRAVFRAEVLEEQIRNRDAAIGLIAVPLPHPLRHAIAALLLIACVAIALRQPLTLYKTVFLIDPVAVTDTSSKPTSIATDPRTVGVPHRVTILSEPSLPSDYFIEPAACPAEIAFLSRGSACFTVPFDTLEPSGSASSRLLVPRKLKRSVRLDAFLAEILEKL